MRKPDRTEREVISNIPVIIEVWIDPCDLTWDELVDTSVCGEKPPEGTEAWDVIVEARIELLMLDGQSETMTIKGGDSLVGIMTDNSPESSKYLEEQIAEVKKQALHDLGIEIEKHASGVHVARAEKERDTARNVVKQFLAGLAKQG